MELSLGTDTMLINVTLFNPQINPGRWCYDCFPCTDGEGRPEVLGHTPTYGWLSGSLELNPCLTRDQSI